MVFLSAKTVNTKGLASESVVDVYVGESTTTTQTNNIGVEVTSSRNFDHDLVALNVVTSTARTNTSTNRESAETGFVELLDEEVTFSVDIEYIIKGTNSESVVDSSTANLLVTTFSQVPSTNGGVESSNDEVVPARSQLPLTNDVRRIEGGTTLTGYVEGDVRVTSRSASTMYVTSVLNNPESVAGKRSDVVVVSNLTGITNRGSTDTFNEGEVNDQTSRVVQIYRGGDEGSESLDIGKRTF